jgi:hypothetical protein
VKNKREVEFYDKWGFYHGARVVATEKAFESGRFKRKDAPIFGTVTGFGRSLLAIRIRRDNRRSSAIYHTDFWKRADASN